MTTLSDYIMGTVDVRVRVRVLVYIILSYTSLSPLMMSCSSPLPRSAMCLGDPWQCPRQPPQPHLMLLKSPSIASSGKQQINGTSE